jgi:hypothetical protein
MVMFATQQDVSSPSTHQKKTSKYSISNPVPLVLSNVYRLALMGNT